MQTYVVTSKATGAEVYRYNADAPIEWAGMEFAAYDHTAVVDVVEIAPTRIVYDAFAFLRRFTADERIGIRTRAKSDPVAEDFMALLDKASQVESDDADLVAGLTYCAGAGLLAEGRVAEILGVA